MKKIAITILVMGLINSSCDDFLDQVPQDAYTDASLFQSEQDFRGFLNTVYNQQHGHSGTNNWPNRGLDVMTVWTEDGWGRRDCCSGSSLGVFEAGDGKINNIYNDSYTNLRQINEFLTYAPQAENSFPTAELYKRYIAEARFHRAYYYHRLNTFFGAVPLVLELTGALDYRERNTRLSVFEWIDSELVDIANDLPESYTGADVGRITSGAAKALRGRHLLYAIGWHPDVASLYSRAETTLQEVVDSGIYALVDGPEGYDRLFTKAGAVTTENLWSKYYDRTSYGSTSSNTGTSTGIPFLSLPPGSAGNNAGRVAVGNYGVTSRLVEAYQMTNGLDIHDPLSGYDPANPWDNRDPRLDATVLRSGEALPRRATSDINDTYILNTHPLKTYQIWDEGSESFVDDPNAVTVEYATNNNFKTGYFYQKYRVDFNWLDLNDAKLADIQYHFIRYAEVLLLLAEAKLGNSNDIAGAMTLVSQVRDRVNMPATTATDATDALDKILYERRVELATEGPFRYYDIRRHRLGNEVFSGTLPGGGDKATVYGIPLGDGGAVDADVDLGDLDDSKKEACRNKELYRVLLCS